MRYREPEIQRQIVEFLSYKKIFFWRQNSGQIAVTGRGRRERWIRIGKPGMPDLLCVLPPNGRLLGLEVKSEIGKLTERQKEVIEELRNLGCICEVVRSVEDVERILQKIETGK